jgi:hypothetical protein
VVSINTMDGQRLTACVGQSTSLGNLKASMASQHPESDGMWFDMFVEGREDALADGAALADLAGNDAVDEDGGIALFMLPREAPQLLEVRGGCGWALNGILFTFRTGAEARQRTGFVSTNGCVPIALDDDQALNERIGSQAQSVADGARVLRVTGFNLAGGTPAYPCYGIALHLSDGGNCLFQATHSAWRGAPFEYEVPMDRQFKDVVLEGGKCTGLVYW